MVRDVLDLVRDRPHVDLLQPGQRVAQGLAFDGEPQEPGRNLRLELGRQRRAEALGLERRIAGRLRAERVEMCCEMPVHADRLHERHRSRDRGEEISVRGRAPAERGGVSHRIGFRMRARASIGGAAPLATPFPSLRAHLDQLGETGQRRQDAVVRALEELTPRGIDGLRVLEVLLEERPDVAGVQIARHDLEERVVGRDRDDHADEEGECGHDHRDAGERAVCHGHPGSDEREEDRDRRKETGLTRDREPGERERERAEEPGDVVRTVLVDVESSLTCGLQRRGLREGCGRGRSGRRPVGRRARRSRRSSQAHGVSGTNASPRPGSSSGSGSDRIAHQTTTAR